MDRFSGTALQTTLDVLPIMLVILVFQLGVLRRKPRNLKTILIGGAYTLVGLILFRLGLEDTLLPLGSSMAQSLVTLGPTPLVDKQWYDHFWLLLFAGLIGLAATLIEPTLSAVASRVDELTGGEMRAMHLRYVVATGVAFGLMLGTLRILLGIPILFFVIPILALLGLMSINAPKTILPLALDTGPMATSVVTVPLIAAFGIAVADTIPGRDPILDGFGLVFFALLMPVLSVLLFTFYRRWKTRWFQLPRRSRDV